AKWNGENWEPLGNGLNFSVSALEVHNDYLFAGGNFSKSGNIDVLGIARWDGAEWNPVGSGLLGFARSLHSDGNLLHIGGRFRMAGNKPAFNYTTWGQLATSVDEEELSLPAAFELFQNYPNPFNPTTVIQFNLPQQDNVSLEIFNSIGQSVARLVNGPRQAGIHQVQFNASGLSSGVYFYRLKTNNFAETKKLTIIK
ncbi:MAG: T9SS type A sorting domain-containing protein, partial [Balneolaceae bacterium]